MTTFDEKFYELITKKENFEYANEIHQRFDKVLDTLYERFWSSLNKIITKNRIDNFKVNSVGVWEIEINCNDWEYFKAFISWNDEYKVQYGIYLSNKSIKKKISKIDTYFENSDYLFELSNDSDNNIYTLYFDEDFAIESELIKIIPENVDELNKKYSDTFWEFVNSISKDIKYIEKQINNNGEISN